jgi:uncharacterized protein (DUF2249 family)
MTTINTPTRQGGCACGHDDETLPELDARLIPHQLRHAAVFGAFDSLHPGQAMALVAPHDPLPLLSQFRDRYADGVDVTYLVSGPESWKIKLARV